MFPYADNPEDYWTGYFTSRAGAKKQVRTGQSVLHSTSAYYVKHALNQNVSES
jgi:hypothetical protein